MNKTLIRRLVSFGLLIILVVAASKYVDLSLLLDAELTTLLELVIIVMAIIFLRAHMIKVSLVSHGIALRFIEWFGLNVYSSLLNLALPLRAGLSIRGVYLKKVHGLLYAEFAGLQAGVSFLQLVFISLCGASFLFFIGLRMDSVVVTSLVLVLLLTIGAMFVVIRRLNEDRPYQRAVLTAYRSFISLAHHPKVLLKLLLDNSLLVVCSGLAFYLVLSDMGHEISLLSALFTVVAITLINVVNLTPGNLGVQEFGAAYISQMLGGSFDAGFVAMLLIRCVSVSCWLLLSPFIFAINSRLSRANIVQPR